MGFLPPAPAVAIALVLAFTSERALPDERPAAASFTTKSLSGESLSLEDLLAKGPVLLDFWATWCKPCVTALPEIQAIHERYGPRGLTVIGISADGPRNFGKVRPFVARLGLTYPIVTDQTGDLQKNYRVIGLPTTVLIDTDRSIVSVRQGFRPGEGKSLAELIESILPPSPDDSKTPLGGSPSGDGTEP